MTLTPEKVYDYLRTRATLVIPTETPKAERRSLTSALRRLARRDGLGIEAWTPVTTLSLSLLTPDGRLTAPDAARG